MGAECLWHLLDEDRAWLELQPGLSPWPEGRAMLARQIHEWLVQYSQGVCSAVVDVNHAGYQRYCQRLWTCWRHHWQQAVELDPSADGLAVGESVRSGEGYSRGKQLGGDPLRDVVLAEAVQSGDGTACALLEAEYKPFCIAQGRAVNREAVKDADDWWYQLLDRLAGYSRQPGKLQSYSGKCGLRFWLGRVARNFANDWRDGCADGGNAVDEWVTPPTPDAAEVDDCIRLLAGFVRRGLDGLASDERLVLCLIFVDDLPGKEVAKLLGVAPGNISRRRAKAESRLRELLQQEALARGRAQGVEDCLELVGSRRNWQHFAEVFCDLLRKSRPEDAPPQSTGEVRS